MSELGGKSMYEDHDQPDSPLEQHRQAGRRLRDRLRMYGGERLLISMRTGEVLQLPPHLQGRLTETKPAKKSESGGRRQVERNDEGHAALLERMKLWGPGQVATMRPQKKWAMLIGKDGDCFNCCPTRGLELAVKIMDADVAF